MDMGGFFAGSIFTKLVLDKSGWNSAMAETKTQADGMAKGPLAGLGTAFGGVGTMAAGAGLAIVGAMAAAVKQTADYGDKLWELHLKTGVSVETLSGLKLAAEESGTSIDGLATGFKKLGMGMDDAQKGTGKAGDAFRALKIDIKDSQGGLRDMDDVMLDVADRFSKMEDGAGKVALAIDLFGRSGMELIPFLNEGRDGLEKLTAKAKELGLVIDEETAAAGDKFNDTLTELKGAVQGVTMELGKALMPLFTAVAEKLVDVVAGVRKWLEQNPWLIESVKELAGQVFTLAENLIKLSANALMLISQLPDLLKELTGLDIKMTDLTAGGLPFLNFLLDGASDADKMGASVRLMAGDCSQAGLAMGGAGEAGTALWKSISDTLTPLILTTKQMEGYEQILRTLIGTTKKFLVDLPIEIEGLTDLEAMAKKLGLTLRTDVNTQIKEAEDALVALHKAHQDTPAAVQALTEKILKLKTMLVDTNDPMVAMSLHLDELKLRWAKYGSELPAKEQYDLNEQIKNAEFAMMGMSRETLTLSSQYLPDLTHEFSSEAVVIKTWYDEVTRATTKIKEIPDLLLEGRKAAWEFTHVPLDGYLRDVGDAAGGSRDEMADLIAIMEEAFTFDDAARIKTITTLLQDYGDTMPIRQQQALREEMAMLKLGDYAQEWMNLRDNVAGSIGGIASDCLALPTSVKNSLDSLPPLIGKSIEGIYDAFKTMVGELITKWVKNFLLDALVGQTASAAAKATKSLVGIGETVMKTTGDVAGGAAKVATGAIAGAATSVVNTISGVVTAVASVLALFKKDSNTDITYWLKFITDSSRQTADWLRISYMGYVESWDGVFESIRYCVYELHGRLVETRDAVSYWGQAIVDAIKGVTHMQGGGYVPRTMLAVVHAGERVLPASPILGSHFASSSPASAQEQRPIQIFFEGEPLDLKLSGGIRRALVRLTPQLSKNEQVLFHARSWGRRF